MTLESGHAHLRRGELSEAEREYRAALRNEPANAEAMHLLGFIALQRREWQVAEDWIGRSLRLQPAQPMANLNLGIAMRNLGRLTEALACFDRALLQAPDDVLCIRNRAEALAQLNRVPEALESLDAALRRQPSSIQLINARGVLLGQIGRLEEALHCFQRIVQLDPDSTWALHNTAKVLLELGRHEPALRCYDELLARKPDDAETLSNRAVALMQAGRLEESLLSVDRAIALEPRSCRALNNRGAALRLMGRLPEALQCFERALEICPDDPDILTNQAVALSECHRHASALECHDRALRIRADHPDLYYNRGNTWLALRQCERARQDYERALQLQPMKRDALFNLGIALYRMDRLEEAAAAFARLLKIDEAYPLAMGMRAYCHTRLCDWTDSERSRAALTAAIRAGRLVEEPFAYLAVSDDAADQRRCAEVYAAEYFPAASRDAAPVTPGRDSRIRVAYISGDYRDHPVSRLIVGVLEQHARDRLEVIGISLQPPDASPAGQRVKDAFDRFIDVSGRSDAEVVQMMRETSVDIAVDLMGFTEGRRTSILARRAAPVQVSLIGYPGTMGVPYLDYIIADRTIIPPERAAHYRENVVYLPDCFQPNDDRRFVPQSPARRTALGLPERGLVFCCMNNCYKLNGSTFDVWMRLLREVPESVLWLFAQGPAVERNLRREAQSRGVDPGRIVLTPRVPYEQYLTQLTAADIYLDTFPFNGGTTTSDVLWVGLPVLTCLGEAFASRMAASLLVSLGLGDLVTGDLGEYERTALDLARDPARLDALRARLREARLEGSTFDTARYCRHLETAYQRMSDLARTGRQPESFAV